MHRHAYQGRKLSRAIGPRRALMRNLVTSLLLHERVETTLAKAKEVVPQVERLITVAKKGGLTARRTLGAQLTTENAINKLLQELAPAFKERTSGHVRIIKTGIRRGDSAPMAVVALILPEKINQETTDSGENSESLPKKAVKSKLTAPKAAVKAKEVKHD